LFFELARSQGSHFRFIAIPLSKERVLKSLRKLLLLSGASVSSRPQKSFRGLLQVSSESAHECLFTKEIVHSIENLSHLFGKAYDDEREKHRPGWHHPSGR
jgi:hypothetical protein